MRAHTLLHCLIMAAVAGMSGCSSPSASTGDAAARVSSGIEWLGEIPAGTGGDPFAIVGQPRIAADSLYVTVQYGGGCTRHEFGLLARNGFMESHPVQLAVAIRHRANNDHCRALITRELAFGLARIRQRYSQDYQERHGVIILRLSGYEGAIRYEF